MSNPVQLLDLPIDILYLIFPYLDVSSFVSLTSTCKALHQPDIAQYAAYWSSVTRTTFRIPNQPVVENDGNRWQKMYRRLLTESRVFTWGGNDKACLGHSNAQQHPVASLPPAMRRRRVPSMYVPWPTEMENTESLGIIADMQCGGWSTNILTSKGGLYSTGAINGQTFQRPKYSPEKLRYPAGFPHPSERYDQATSIKQFSAGRAHILALSDSGAIWSWNSIDHAAFQVKFLSIDLKEGAPPSVHGHVKKVIAGWGKSTAFVVGTGIVLWDPLARSPNNRDAEEDTALVLETAIVPRTNYQRQVFSQRTPSSDEVGEVESFICLEHHIVFNTHVGKVFAARITWTREAKEISDIRQLPLSDSQFASDVQGSFHSFAIFTREGEVLTGTQDHLDALFSSEGRFPELTRIPALQHTKVISIAFGDYHFHALHAPGYITSYGREPKGCGCLGLGGTGNPEGRLRGLRYQAMGGDANLVPHADLHGRRVWFEKEKQEWITFLTSGGRDPEEAKDRMRMCAETNVQGEVSEWVEQEGRAWEERFGGEVTSDRDGLGSYFALSVTAAGWHSGALILVNEDRVKKVREGCLVQPKEPPVPEHTEDDATGQEDQDETRGLIDRTIAYASDWSRWFLGLPTPAGNTAAGPSFRDPNDPHAFSNPQNHGAATEDGRAYVWAQESFPRLRLADGREMPGTTEFSEWRYGRPNWDGIVEGR